MMKKFLICALAFTSLGSSLVYAADELDNILFVDSPKKEQSSLISPPKIQNQIKVENKPLLQPMEVGKDEFDFEDVVPAIEEDNEPVVANTNGPDALKVGAADVSLTDVIRNEAATNPPPADDSVFAGTWVEKLKDTQFSVLTDEATSPAEKVTVKSSSPADKGLEMMMNDSKKQIGKSNASVFDISGVMLRMSLPQVEETLAKRGYKMVSQKFEIPNFVKWRFEENCRNAGVVGYERIASCVVKAAKENKHQYVESVKFSKFDTKEEVAVSFTSNFTNNKVYKVMYRSMSTKNMNGSGQKAQYLYDIKVYDFWKRINQKYGIPDNKDDVIWGMGGNKPYMKAATGSLLLEDPMLRELDFTRMSREDQKFMNTNTYNF